MKKNMSELTNKIMQEHESIAEFCAAADLNPEEFNRELSAGDISAKHIERRHRRLEFPPKKLAFISLGPLQIQEPKN